MCDNDKKLNKILVISEKDTPRSIQQLVQNTTTFTEENLEEYDINSISSVKETSRYGFISSKITKNAKILSGKCVKLTGTQVIIWKNGYMKEYVIIFVENDSSVTDSDNPRHTVHINLIKSATKECKPVKYNRVTNRRHITQRNATRISIQKNVKRNMKKQLKSDKSKNIKFDQKPQKPRILQNTKNLDLFLKNSIIKDKNFSEKYVTAIFTTQNVTKSEEISKIFVSRHISYKNDLTNFVNIIEDICPSIKCDKYEYIRRKIEKNNIPIDRIKSITFIRKKYVRIYVRKNSKILPKFANNLMNKACIKINGEQFVSAKNWKLENVKLFTPKYQKKWQNVEENIVNDTINKVDEILDKNEPEECIQSSNEDQTSLLKVDTKKQTKIIQESQKLVKDVNEKPKSNKTVNQIVTLNQQESKLPEDQTSLLKIVTKKQPKLTIQESQKLIKDINEKPVIQIVTSNQQESKLPSKETIPSKNGFKQTSSAPKPVVKQAVVENKPVIVNKDTVLAQVQETLKIVTARLEKNSQIIKEIASKSNQFFVRGFKIPLHKREAQKNGLPPKNNETESNAETQKSNGTSEVSLKSTFDQNKILKKMKRDKKLVTITPIKNFIVDNKRKVGDNSIRSGHTQKTKKSSNISDSIDPVISSQYIIFKNGKKTKLNKIIPVVQTGRTTSVSCKVIRPVRKNLPESQSFSRLTEEDLVPFRSEYPRKDHLPKPNNRMNTFLHQLCSSNTLEPLIKCGDKNCKSCIMLANVESKKKLDSDKNAPKNTKFDFKQYLNEPSTSYSTNCSLYPITEIQISPKNNVNQNLNPGAKKSTPISTIYPAKQKQISTDISKNPSLSNKLIKKNLVRPSNKIQKTIEQSISKNNGHQKLVKQITKSVQQTRNTAGKTLNNNRKGINLNNVRQNPKNLAPKIFTPRKSYTFLKSAPKKFNPICNKQKVNISKDTQRELLFDQKYKMAKTICNPLNASKNMLLDKLSHTDANSQPDIQKYLQIIEQKFLKTFSLPEEEKVNAYNTLAQEINDMLAILSTENTKEKQLKIIESLERLTNAAPYKSRSYEKVSHSMEKFKFTTHSLINLTPKMMLPETTSSEEIKKKVADNAQPTVCTESINFMKSLTAIMSKQTQLFPTVSETRKETLKKPVSILKISSSEKVTNAKKVRFGASDSKILKSDVSVTFSSDDDDDEDYSTINEEDVINFTSEEDVSSNCLQFPSLIYFKSDISYAFVENLAEISYDILVFHHISFIEHESLHSIAQSDTFTEIDIRIKDFDVTYSKSNFTFSSSTNIPTATSSVNLNYTFSDMSSSNFDVDNSDYIPIEAKGSPNVIEFLDIMANLSFEPVPYLEEIFYQSIITYIHTTYETEVYHPINIYHEIEIHFANNLQALVPKLGEQSKQLSELTGNINVNLCPRLVSLKSLKLHSQYLEMAYRLQKKKYESLVNLRKTRSLDMMLPVQNIHSQTLVLNMHVQNYQQDQIDDERLNIKCLEAKKDIRKAEENCTAFCNESEKNLRSYKSILIFLYIAIFSTILFCAPLVNYKCE